MKSLYLYPIGVAQAAIGFGWCEIVPEPQVRGFDRNMFAGDWYEIYSDFNMQETFGRECIVSTY